MTLVLRGHCPSKKNLWRRGRGGHTYIDSETQTLIDALTIQAEEQWKREPVKHPGMRVQFFVASRRQDRDNMLTTILDCLKKAGVIEDDNIARFNGVLTLLPALLVFEEDERTVVEVICRN